MIQGYENGGVKMLDIGMMQKGFLCAWGAKIYNNHQATFAAIPTWLLKPIVPSLNLSTVNSKFEGLCPQERVKCLPEFYQRMLKEFLDSKEICGELNLGDMIWNNSMLQYHGHVLNFEGWSSVGLVYVNQILGIDHKILPYDELFRLVKIKAIFMFEYNALKHALQQCTIKDEVEQREYAVSGTLWGKAKCKDYVQNLLIKSKERPHALNYWERNFPNVSGKWTQLWNICYTTTTEPRLKSLQWKILHRVYPTNILLKKMGKSHSDLCAVCHETDTLEHFFVDCMQVKPMWQRIERSLFNNPAENRPGITNEDKIFGYKFNEINNYVLENVLIMIGKLCISKFKYGEYPNLCVLLERECAVRNIIL